LDKICLGYILDYFSQTHLVTLAPTKAQGTNEMETIYIRRKNVEAKHHFAALALNFNVIINSRINNICSSDAMVVSTASGSDDRGFESRRSITKNYKANFYNWPLVFALYISRYL
jgi:hypothetical protein